MRTEQLAADVGRLALALDARVPRAVPRALGDVGEAHTLQVVGARADRALEQVAAVSTREAEVIVLERQARRRRALCGPWRRETLRSGGGALATSASLGIPRCTSLRRDSLTLVLRLLPPPLVRSAALGHAMRVGKIGRNSCIHAGARTIAGAARFVVAVSEPCRHVALPHTYMSS